VRIISPCLSLEWVQFLSESMLQCSLMLQLWSAIRWITPYSLICLHYFYCFPQVMADMECAVRGQPSYNYGRAERKSTSFTVVVVEGFEDSVVSLSSLCSHNLWSGCFIACAQDVLVWWNLCFTVYDWTVGFTILFWIFFLNIDCALLFQGKIKQVHCQMACCGEL
jgi:hypothetical protein